MPTAVLLILKRGIKTMQIGELYFTNGPKNRCLIYTIFI